jgi:hypothetical protein
MNDGVAILIYEKNTLFIFVLRFVLDVMFGERVDVV